MGLIYMKSDIQRVYRYQKIYRSQKSNDSELNGQIMVLQR